jgi:hypothetical protein
MRMFRPRAQPLILVQNPLHAAYRDTNCRYYCSKVDALYTKYPSPFTSVRPQFLLRVIFLISSVQTPTFVNCPQLLIQYISSTFHNLKRLPPYEGSLFVNLNLRYKYLVFVYFNFNMDFNIYTN